MAKLLDTERQFKKKTRRVGIFDNLEKCFETSSRSQEEAIKNAHLKRDLREASLQGDVATIREKFKQLNIGETADGEILEDEIVETEIVEPVEKGKNEQLNKPATFGSMKFKKNE